MKTYIKFIIFLFFKSFLYIVGIMFSLAFIINLMSELDFFRNLSVETYFPIFLSIINSPDMIFQMFPFIFLLTTQLFFVKLFNNNEIEVFKHSGLKNTKILFIISIISIVTGILISLIFYNFSSNLKNLYLKLKSPYASDGKYLAVITKDGLWIKDEIGDKILIINSTEINNNFLIKNHITEFDKSYNVIRNIKSDKIDISKNIWLVYNPIIFNKNNKSSKDLIKIQSNFNYQRISTLYSNLSSLNIYLLYELRENYKKLNYSLTDIDLQFLKLFSFPILLFLITIFGSLLMFKVKRYNSPTAQITIGLFLSVIIYYSNNFFYALGSTEKISIFISIFAPLVALALLNILMLKNINEK